MIFDDDDNDDDDDDEDETDNDDDVSMHWDDCGLDYIKHWSFVLLSHHSLKLLV